MAGEKVTKLVALACSTGGPSALHKMVPMLPEHVGAPIVIVQHMPGGFTKSLADRLDVDSNVHVVEATDGEVLKNDWVYIAPGGRHLEIVENKSKDLVAKVYDGPPVDNLRPCANVMYRSLMNISLPKILCVVLTGMGSDGTAGITELKSKKNVYCISEDKSSCIVYGMPKSIETNNLSDYTCTITEMANAIIKKLGDQ